MQLRLQKFMRQSFLGFHGIPMQKFQLICMHLELWYGPGLTPKPDAYRIAVNFRGSKFFVNSDF